MSGSGGKKKSGFQITSVTSEYEQREARGGGAVEGAAEEPQPPLPLPPRNGPSAPASLQGPSRFRVVKLAQGSGEPYRRGRWTCRDFYEPEPDPPAPPTARLPQSLDSRLEVAGLLLAPPRGPFSPQPLRRGGARLQAQLVLPPPGPSGHQARSLGGGLPVLARPHRAPPPPPDGAPDPHPELSLPADEHLPPTSVAQRIHREAEDWRKVLSRETRSRPSSPAPPLFRDASPGRRTSDPFGVARFTLARSVFGVGIAHDGDDDSGTNSSMIAIDNKIEQAMDLVKTHLMFAVREEVEVLRDQIKDLSERNTLLEQENALLRSLASSEQLTRFQAQIHTTKPPPNGTA